MSEIPELITWTCGNCGREYYPSSDGYTLGFCEECLSEDLDEETGEIY